jgi:multiple sugar transport system permease protein
MLQTRVNRYRIIRKTLRVMRMLTIFVVLCFFLVPFYIMLSNALKPNIHINAYPPVFVFKPTLEHFVVIFERHPFGQYFLNSLIISGGATAIGFVVGIPAAYAIARFRLRQITSIVLICRMFPFISVLLPWFIMTQRAGLLDSYTPVILSHLVFTIPYATMIMIGFFEDIPADLEEAAWIDGCSRMGTFIKIILPLTIPGMVAASIIAFSYSWNNFLFALILTASRVRTLPVAAYSFLEGDYVEWGGLSAAATLITLPIMLFALLVQRYLVRGLTTGGVK